MTFVPNQTAVLHERCLRSGRRILPQAGARSSEGAHDRQHQPPTRWASPHADSSLRAAHHTHSSSAHKGLLPACQERSIALVGYSPFGQGRLPRGPGWSVLEAVAKERNPRA